MATLRLVQITPEDGETDFQVLIHETEEPVEGLLVARLNSAVKELEVVVEKFFLGNSHLHYIGVSHCEGNRRLDAIQYAARLDEEALADFLEEVADARIANNHG